MTARDLAVRERLAFAELLETITPEEWQASSLCGRWTVRDVAIHVVSYDALGWRGLPGAFVRGGPRVDAVNEHVLRRHDGLGPDEVVALVRRHAEPRGLPSALGGAIALTDGMIHQQDIRRPLGRPRDIPADALHTALGLALKAPTVPGRRNARGLHLVATDTGWEHGRGERVEGPAEALLMAVAGRSDALPELRGAGADVLARRVT